MKSDSLGKETTVRRLIQRLWTPAALLFAALPAVAVPPPMVNLNSGTLVIPTAAWANYYSAGAGLNPTSGVAAWVTRPPEIQALARSLVSLTRFTQDQNAARVFDYVRLNIETEFRFGLGKGSRGAAIDQSGTPFDQAQLMVDILRAGGITAATYQIGEVTFTAQEFGTWSRLVSGVNESAQTFTVSAKAACNFLADGGIPATVNGATSCTTLSDTAALTSLTMLHIWVKVGGLVYDPSYKRHVLRAGIDVPNAMGCGTFSAATCGSAISNAGLVGANYSPNAVVPSIQNVNSAGIKSLLTTYASNLQTIIQGVGRFTPVEAILGGGLIDTTFSPLIGSNLPLANPGQTLYATLSNIPDVFRTTLTVQGLGLNQTLFADEIAGKRLRVYTGTHGHTYARSSWVVVEGRDVQRSEIAATAAMTDNITLVVNHPYAADANGGATLTGTYADDTQTYYAGGDPRTGPPTGFASDYHNGITIVWSLGRTGQGPQKLMSALQSTDEDELSFTNNSTEITEYYNMPPETPTLAAQYVVQLDAATTILEGVGRSRISPHHVMGVGFGLNSTFNVSASTSVTPVFGNAADKNPTFFAWGLLMECVEGSVGQQTTNTLDPFSAVSLMSRAIDAHQAILAVNSANWSTAQGLLSAGGYSTARQAAIKAITDAGSGLLLVSAPSFTWNLTMPTTAGRLTSSPVMNISPSSGGGELALDPTGKMAYLIGESIKGAILAGEDPQASTLKTVRLGEYSLKDKKSFSLDSITGAVKLTPAPDIVVGTGAFPESLSFQRTYSSEEAPRLSCTDAPDHFCSPDSDSFPDVLSYGWHHNLEISAEWSSDGIEGFGATSAVRAATAIASLYVAIDLARLASLSSLADVAVVGQAMDDSLMQNVFAVHLPDKTLLFARLADGTYDAPINEPAAQITFTGAPRGPFVAANNRWVYDYSAVLPQYRSSSGDTVKFVYSKLTWTSQNTNFNYAAPSFTIKSWLAPSGMQATFTYSEQPYDEPEQDLNCPNICSDAHYDKVLTQVVNSLNHSLTFQTTEPFAHFHVITSVTDEMNNQVSFLRTFTGLTNAPAGFTYTVVDNDGDFTVTAVDGLKTRYSYVASAQSYLILDCVLPQLRLRKWYTPSSGTTPYLTFLYDTQQHLQSMTDSLGQVTTMNTAAVSTEFEKRGEIIDPTTAISGTYADRFGNHTVEIDPLGRMTKHVYSDARKLLQTTFPELNYDVFTYDVRSNLLSTTHFAKPGSGLTSLADETIAYNEGPTVPVCTNLMTCNRPAHVYDALNRDTAYGYDGTTGQLTLINHPADPSGTNPQSRFCYGHPNGSVASLLTGRIDKVSGSANLVTTYGYNSANKFVLSSVTADPVASLDLNCNALTKSSGMNLVSGFTFDSVGNVATIDEPRTDVTDVTTYHFDAMRRLTRVDAPAADAYGFASPVSGITRYTYDLDGLLLTTRHSLVAAPSDSNPSNPRPTDLVASDWQTESRSYYTTGDLQSVMDAQGNTTQYTYDGAGRQVMVTDADGRRVGTVYDGAGQITCTFRGWNSATPPTRPSCFSWDPVSYSGSGPVRYSAFTYEPNGKQLTVADADNNATTSAWDGFDRLSSTIYPNSKHEDLQYTVDGTATGARCVADSQPCRKITRANQIIAYTYDGLNRLFTRAPAGQGTVTLSYDLRDQPLSVSKAAFGTSPAHLTSYGYDGAGRRKSETNDGRSVSYQLDNAGNRLSTTWPDNYFVSYGYDVLNRMTLVQENGSLEIGNYRYDVLSRRQYLCLGGQSVACAAGGGTNRTSYSYEPDNDLGGLTQILNSVTVDLGYGHNGSHQINSASASDGFYLVGRANTAAAPTTAFVPNNMNQYTTIGGQAATYDDNGNLTSWFPPGGSGKQIYCYDSESRLLAVAVNDCATASITYDYDGLGRRVSKTVPVSGTPVTTTYLLDGDEEVAEYIGATLQRRYIPGSNVDERIAHIELTSGAPVRTYYHVNHQGSVIAMTDTSGTITQPLAYDEYGNLTSSTSASITGEVFRFTGRRFDAETGLYYYRARYYSPILGRFLQPDSVGYKDDLNLYAYVANNPLNSSDPTGTEDFRKEVEQATRERGGEMPEVGTTAEAKLADKWVRTVMAAGLGAVIAAPVIASALPAAPAVAEVSSADAVSVARGAAAVARAEGATAGATSGLVTASGETFTGASTAAGGPGAATNATVQAALDAVPQAARSAYHGCCGEINAFSNAANAGARLKDAVVATVRAAGRGADQVMKACATCRAVADKLGVKIINP